MSMIQSAKRLHALGFAIHWLRPKSKAPIENGWTTGPRAPWPFLVDRYKDGNNVGVRLGTPSKFPDGTYLSVIDCDVKSKDPRHVKEMNAKLKELITAAAPEVSSGRGNGSKHLYVRTEKPSAHYTWAKSDEKVKVHMPSAKPSNKEVELLSKDELLKGLRLRNAWEISVMGEGQQVVLPPSIHPDTGGPYTWVREINGIESMPMLAVRESQKGKDLGQVANDFTVAKYDLATLPESTRALITDGDNCDDRSAALFGVAVTMIRAEWTDDQILSCLTERDTYLGACAYDHAKTTSRARAAQWVRKYTLNKARAELSADQDFEDEYVELPALPKEKIGAHVLELVGPPDWRKTLEMTGSGEGARAKSTAMNLKKIFENEAPGCFKRDEFANAELYGCDTPWGGKEGAEVQDIDIVRIKYWFARHHRIEPSTDKINEAIAKLADENRYHPVRDFLDTLEWDGESRLSTWLKDYHDAEAPEPYLSAVSRKVVCAMIARVYEPGCKFDQVMILEGKQGCGKSTAVSILSNPWFSDAHITIGDKDAVLAMRSIWVLELGELSGISKADTNLLKGFISSRVDRIRLPYGRRTENFPRQSILIGTTNPGDYLRDVTGNRRFWPVNVGKCDFEKLRRDRDQILAEAKVRWEFGEKLYLETKEMNEGAVQEQEGRMHEDTWATKLGDFLESEKGKTKKERLVDLAGFPMGDLFGEDARLPFAGAKDGVAELRRAADALRACGFEKFRGSTGRKLWKRGEF